MSKYLKCKDKVRITGKCKFQGIEGTIKIIDKSRSMDCFYLVMWKDSNGEEHGLWCPADSLTLLTKRKSIWLLGGEFLIPDQLDEITKLIESREGLPNDLQAIALALVTHLSGE